MRWVTSSTWAPILERVPVARAATRSMSFKGSTLIALALRVELKHPAKMDLPMRVM